MRVVTIFLSLLLLSACGGSGSSNSSPTEVIRSTSSPQSSLSLSSPASQSYSSVAPLSAPLVVEEDTTLEVRPSGLTDQVSAYLVDIFVFPSGKRIPMEAESRNGGKIVISNDGKVINYTPKKNFFGDDEFYYWIQGVSTNAMVKVNIKVTPVADTQHDISFNENHFFISGDLVMLDFLLDVDTQQYFSPDSSTRILINSAPVNYTVNSNNIALVVPAVERAGVQLLVYEQEMQGQLIRVEKHLLVKIDDGDVTYYQGNSESPGQAVVIVWTEGTESVYPDVWMNKELGFFLKIPLHLRYSKYFNISAIKPIAKRKLYPGTMTADFDFYSEFVSRYSQSNMQMVIMVSELGGGNAGSHVTMGPDGGAKLLLHELGHLHARLGDEYVSPVHSPEYDGGYPNVTHFHDRDVEQVQWKHWLADKNRIPGIHIDPVSDIQTGVFMGAHYTKIGLYRPTKNSVMNSGTQLGDVNSEAWALANYEYLGLLSSATNEKTNGQRVISIVRAWDKNITRVDWFVDGVKQEQFTNLARLVVDESTISKNTYTINAEITDLTGYIKNVLAYPVFSSSETINKTFSRTWNIDKTGTTGDVQKTTKVASGDSFDVGDEWISYAMIIVNGDHKISSTNLYGRNESMLPVTGASDLMVDVIVADKVIYRQGVDLQQFDLVPVYPPGLQSGVKSYRISHPKIKGNYLLRIYSFPQKILIAEFAH